MQKVLCLVLVIAAFVGCDPGIKTFEVVPQNMQCPGPVKITWEGDADGGRIQADQPVSPPLPPTVLKKGTMNETVSQTTTFMFFYPSAAHREKTVTVANQGCGPACGPSTLALTGECTTSSTGPSYIVVNVNAANAPGNLKQLTNDANFPVHVLHAGQDIALGAGGGPIFPLPVVPAAGDYTIYVPGVVGQNLCAGAGPTGGGTIPAPLVHLFVTPTCPP